MQCRRRSGYFGFISDSEPGMASLLIWLSVWRTPVKGVSSFLDCVYGVVCQGFSDVTLGGGGASLFGGVRVRPGVYREQLPLAVCDGRRPPMCGSVACRMSGTCGAKRKHRSHNTCTPQRDSENERNHE